MLAPFPIREVGDVVSKSVSDRGLTGTRCADGCLALIFTRLGLVHGRVDRCIGILTCASSILSLFPDTVWLNMCFSVSNLALLVLRCRTFRGRNHI